MTEIILESISDGVFTVDMNWVITSFNRAAETITGINRDKAIGAYCYEVFKSNMCEEACPLSKTMKTGKPIINKNGFIINLKGKKIPVSVSTALLKDNNGKILGGAETFRDLSELEKLKTELKRHYSLENLKTNSPLMGKIIDILPTMALSNSTVLIEGETGTGKELIARTIHELSSRRNGPFIAVNCSALPETLLESELFGYKKGAFTGADRDKPGRFSLAENGTLFLDEIGELSLNIQVKLLRVLQEKKYEPLGGIKPVSTNARILCASNRKLKELVRESKIRQDLYFRINILYIELPPLRKRKEDIPLLSEKLIKKFNLMLNKDIIGLSKDVYSVFYNYDWPGNIRELENIIERSVIMCPDKIIGLHYLPDDVFDSAYISSNACSYTNSVRNAEKHYISEILKKNNYNRTKSALELNIDKSTLYRKIKKYGINLPSFDGRHKL